MLRRIFFGLLGAVAGYIGGTVLGYFLVTSLSSNTHDRAVEAAMTGAFVVGPVAAVIACILGSIWGGRKRTVGDLTDQSL